MAEEGRLVKINQITELQAAKAQIIEVRQYQTTCSECGEKQVETAPPGLEMERTFGVRLEATIVYYRQEQHMSYQRTQLALLNLQGVEISQGGIDEIMQRVGNKAIQAAKSIEETVRQSAVIHSDENGSPRIEFDQGQLQIIRTLSKSTHDALGSGGTGLMNCLIGPMAQ